jgi:NADH-quinone oxidoreductase E subunit
MSKSVNELLSDKEFLRKVEKLKKIYPEERSSLLAILHLCQSKVGYIPEEFQEFVAKELNLSPSHIKGVVTFYEMFFDKPKGRYLIQVCRTLPCMLAGAETLLEHISSKLGIQPGQTTADGKYTLITVECLACCDKGPSMMINDNLYTRVSIEEFDAILKELK